MIKKSGLEINFKLNFLLGYSAFQLIKSNNRLETVFTFPKTTQKGQNTTFLRVIVSFLILFCFAGSLSANSLFETQAENLLRIAEEAYKDRKFHKSIEEIKNFLILYPSSKFKNKAYQVLKDNYSRLGRPEKVLEINLYQYAQEPTSSLGLNALFEAGKLYLEIGEENKAKEVFKSICNQSFSRELAEKASLELSEREILNDSHTEIQECAEK
ncbi:hypothetical protein RBB68_01235 [Leptospira interrogans]|uniref:Tetratricopeptide repeat protein n=1 Tax=Leptospira interrogans serovar Zanoni str. LT2156 TaxID=1001601 RepID=M6HR03_LEPIR|nr:hypothetical protein [Leptospira interrogans]EMM93371.1 hypothetical protein LEP1GSC158_4341 [Leptospira interrogans serovar Zanoni str. LT2156]AJR12838.1 hypothetical protein LIL_10236 [Leptospira interrogans serovar Linhai str. 56609]EJP17541.1 hypothetical protein LEP1GSC080_3962 [Leptospira interrogans str. FPW2026]EKR47172.1 hypothetical protein LEP1GSC097_4353 [Leptospira interrogans serovar Grippotyphosa str. UI 08368]WML94363.1 hypothetical protein RBB68_01235 [Leptospira interrogan